MFRGALSIIALVAALTTAAPAAQPLLVKNAAGAATWTGIVEAGVTNGGPAECAPSCHHVDVTVDLPQSVWSNRSGGLQVAIRWTGAPGDNLRLYVYRDGALVAKSDGIIAIAQGVLIRSASNGIYRVYVAYDADSPSPLIRYDGLAEVEYDPRRIHPAA